MSLGEQISRLRAAQGLSQEDLAGELQVSRQSVSKWETNSSVPDLDRLLKLSELFGVTLDELVKGACDTPPVSGAAPSGAADTAPDEPPFHAGKAVSPPSAVSGVQKVIGIVLLCFGALIAVLLLCLSGSLFGCVLALPFLLCGVICLTAKRRTGLWCGWMWFVSLMLYFRYATGIHWTLVLQTIGFDPQWNYMRLAIAWGMLLAMVLMVVCTARSFRNVSIAPTQRNTLLLAAGWGLWLLLPRLLNLLVFQAWLKMFVSNEFSEYPFRFVTSAEAMLRFMVLNALAVCTLALLRGWKARRSAR